jgi:hypothetical protein
MVCTVYTFEGRVEWGLWGVGPPPWSSKAAGIRSGPSQTRTLADTPCLVVVFYGQNCTIGTCELSFDAMELVRCRVARFRAECNGLDEGVTADLQAGQLQLELSWNARSDQRCACFTEGTCVECWTSSRYGATPRRFVWE